MQDAFRWWDAMEEIAGLSEERAPSPWDVLSLVASGPGRDRPRTAPDGVSLATSLGAGEDARELATPLVLTDGIVEYVG